MNDDKYLPVIPSSQKLEESELSSGKDFSGMDLLDKQVVNADCTECLFNGSLFEGCQFSNCQFRSAEFTEARFSNCTFTGITFDRSDFVLMEVEQCRFECCTFSNAEWREANFDSVEFIDCKFRNTTASLCSFKNVAMDQASSEDFSGQSKRFNLFEESTWQPETPLSINSQRLIEANFGLQAYGESFDYEGVNTLSKLALYHAADQLDGRLFLQLSALVIDSISQTHERNNLLKMKYYAKICTSWARAGSRSVLVRQRLIDLLSQYAKKMHDEILLLELLGVVFKLRVIQQTELDRINRTVTLSTQNISGSANIKIHIESEFDPQIFDRLITMATVLAPEIRTEIQVVSITPGSILIELIASVAAIVTLLRLLSYGMRYLKVFVEESAGTVHAAKKLMYEFKNAKYTATNLDGDVKSPAILKVFQMSGDDKRLDEIAKLLSSTGDDVFDFELNTIVNIHTGQ